MAIQLLPQGAAVLTGNLSQGSTEMPTHTYRLDLENQRISGFVDDQKAMEQAIYKRLETRQYAHDVYNERYGTAWHKLFGKNTGYVMSEIKRRIKASLMIDTRINRVHGFQFFVGAARDSLRVFFTADTRFGDIKIQYEVDKK